MTKGLFRGLAKSIGGFLFTTSLIILIISIALVRFTGYDTLRSIFIDLLSKQILSRINESQLIQLHSMMVTYCEANRNKSVELPFNEMTVRLNCEDVLDSGPEDLGALATASVFDEFYYKKYDCEFIECLIKGERGPETLSIFFSSTANKFFISLTDHLFLGVLIGGFFLAISSKTFFGIFKNIGIPCIMVGLPYLFLNFIKSMLLARFPIQIFELASPAIDQIFLSISDNYFLVLKIGIILTAIGFVGDFLFRKRRG